MAEEDIPRDVRDLLREHIESHEELEALLFLRKRRDRAYGPAAVASEIGISEQSAADALDRLCARNFLDVRVGESSPVFRYAPRDAAVDDTVGRLARACAEHRVETMRLMSANAIERVRTAAMRTFADAFLLGGKKRDG
jgi:hypothetical protein